VPLRPVALVLALTAGSAFAQPAGSESKLSIDDRIAELLKEVRARHDVPALAAAVVRGDGLVGVAAVGVRERGTDVPVTPEDKFHLGSNTKMMTAYMIAALVERGRLKWDDPLEKLLPQAAQEMRSDLRKVTLVHLTAHQAGLPANPAGGWWALVKERSPLRDQRAAALPKLLAEDPVGKAGEKYHYSNAGYVVAAAAAETAACRPWEDLMAAEVFRPLGMASAGFGVPGKPKGPPDQPRQHTAGGKVELTLDNPPLMRPAGGVHCSVPDWAKFVADVLNGARGRKARLKPASYEKLLSTPFGHTDYTVGGWVPVGRGGYGHDGSNTLNYAKVYMDPDRDLAILVATNQGGDPGRKACDEVVAELLKRNAEKP
jgi:CubicO group peptidase (beta-lactamase class C family)